MNKYFLIYLLLLINNITYSQIKFTVSIAKVIDNDKYILKINFANQSKENYAIPVDTTGFRAYYSPQICNKVDYPDKYFAPVLLFKDEKSETYIQANSGSYDIPEMAIENLEKQARIKLRKRKDKIKNWMIKNQFKIFEEAEENYNVIKNIIFLKPTQSFSYEIMLDLSDIRRSNISLNHDRYSLDEKSSYHLSLSVCIDKSIYKLLTSKQIKQNKTYKFYDGRLDSNIINFKVD
jgi:hypothetical protein